MDVFSIDALAQTQPPPPRPYTTPRLKSNTTHFNCSQTTRSAGATTIALRKKRHRTSSRRRDRPRPRAAVGGGVGMAMRPGDGTKRARGRCTAGGFVHGSGVSACAHGAASVLRTQCPCFGRLALSAVVAARSLHRLLNFGGRLFCAFCRIRCKTCDSRRPFSPWRADVKLRRFGMAAISAKKK